MTLLSVMTNDIISNINNIKLLIMRRWCFIGKVKKCLAEECRCAMEGESRVLIKL
mgnify:CR=1 FL=1